MQHTIDRARRDPALAEVDRRSQQISLSRRSSQRHMIIIPGRSALPGHRHTKNTSHLGLPVVQSAAFGVEALGVSGRADGFEEPDGIAEFGLLTPEPRTFLADERRVRCGTCGVDQGLATWRSSSARSLPPGNRPTRTARARARRAAHSKTLARW